MPRTRPPAAVAPAVRRQLEVATAVARERIKEVHLRYALELVEHASEIEPKRALDIYARLHKLGEAESQALGHEVFLALGRRLPARLAAAEGSQDEAAWGAPESILRQIRRRIRGRVNSELRDWVEHHTGRAETALLWAHVENAHQFVELLQPARSAAEAVALYAETLGVPAPRTEIVYYLLLDQRSASPDAIRPLAPSAGVRGPLPAADRRPPSLRSMEPRRETGRHRAG